MQRLYFSYRFTALLFVGLTASACMSKIDFGEDEGPYIPEGGDPGNFEGCPAGCEEVCEVVGEEHVAVVLQACSLATDAMCWGHEPDLLNPFRRVEASCANFAAECLRSADDGVYRCTTEHPEIPDMSEQGNCIDNFMLESTPRGRVVGTDCEEFGGTCDDDLGHCVVPEGGRCLELVSACVNNTRCPEVVAVCEEGLVCDGADAEAGTPGTCVDGD